MHTYIFTCVHISKGTSICVWVYTYMYVHMYFYVCISLQNRDIIWFPLLSPRSPSPAPQPGALPLCQCLEPQRWRRKIRTLRRCGSTFVLLQQRGLLHHHYNRYEEDKNAVYSYMGTNGIQTIWQGSAGHGLMVSKSFSQEKAQKYTCKVLSYGHNQQMEGCISVGKRQI